MKKQTPTQILTNFQNKPNGTIGQFLNVVKKAGYEFIRGGDPMFNNGKVTLRKNDRIFVSDTYSEVISKALSNEQYA